MLSMKTYHPKIIPEGEGQEASVLLPLAEWETVLDELEELQDIRAYDAAKSEPQEKISFAQAVREIQEDYN